MPPPSLRGENSGNPFAGLNKGAEGYAGNLIFAAACLAFATLPWMSEDASFRKIMPYVSAVCGLGAVYLVAAVALRIRRRVAWVEIDRDGLRWSCRGETHRKAWGEVESLSRKERLENGVAIGGVRVRFRDNTELEFNRMLSIYDAVADGIQAGAAAAVRDAKARELAAGAAAFGPVTLRKTGVEHDGREHTWADSDYAVLRGNLVFVPAGAEVEPDNVRGQILLETIPDYAVLLELMERHGKPPAA